MEHENADPQRADVREQRARKRRDRLMLAIGAGIGLAFFALLVNI